MRFLRLFTHRVNHQSIASASESTSRLPEYIYRGSEHSYRITMSEYKLAHKFLMAGDFDKAKRHVDAAIEQSVAIDGDEPAVMSIKISLSRLKNDIESQKSVNTFQ